MGRLDAAYAILPIIRSCFPFLLLLVPGSPVSAVRAYFSERIFLQASAWAWEEVRAWAQEPVYKHCWLWRSVTPILSL